MKLKIKSQRQFTIISKNSLILVINTIIIVLIQVFMYSCTPKPREKAIEFIGEKKYTLALEQFDKFLMEHSNNAWSISDTCLLIGADLYKNGEVAQGRLLYNYAMNLIRSKNLSVPPGYSVFLESLNNRDSIFYYIQNSRNLMSYQDAAYYLMKLSPPDSTVYSAYLFKIPDGYSSDIWLFPKDTSSSFNLTTFGLATFNPITGYLLTKTNLSDIQNISPKAFIRGVKEDMMFFTETYTNELRFSSIPELREIYAQLRTEDELKIASERDRVIAKIIQLREEYLIAYLKFIYTRFEVLGKCYMFKDDYNVDNQQIDMHLSINDQIYGTYIATVRAPLSLSDAQQFFDKYNGFWTTVKYVVSPGTSREELGIAAGGVPDKTMNNLFIYEDPIIQFDNKDGFILKFKAEGLKGLLWPSSVNTWRWDQNSSIEKPNHSFYESNIRIINGIQVK